MKKSILAVAPAALFAAMLLTVPGLVAAQQAPVKGQIISHEGSTIVVRSGSVDTTVQLNVLTKIRGTTGALNVRGEDYPASDLIRGLTVEVLGAPDINGVTASSITFKQADLRTAKQVAAGIVATEKQVAENAAGVANNAAGVSANATGVAENADRIDNVGELVAAGRTKVFFASGSAVITPQGKQDLQAIAEQAKAIIGYRLAVVGRADPTGNPEANQRLSEARANAVKQYLLTACGVLPGRILPAVALGETYVVQDLDPPANDAEARRVTVTIAVSKSARS